MQIRIGAAVAGNQSNQLRREDDGRCSVHDDAGAIASIGQVLFSDPIGELARDSPTRKRALKGSPTAKFELVSDGSRARPILRRRPARPALHDALACPFVWKSDA